MSENDDIAAGWRDNVSRQLENTAKLQQNTALLVERLDGRMTAAENAINELKSAPKANRDIFSTALQAGGCLGSILFACLSLISITITVVMAVSQHWH